MTQSKKRRIHASGGEREEVPQDALLLQLPSELILRVMSLLTLTERAQFSLTCRLFAQLGRDQSLWRVLTVGKQVDMNNVVEFDLFLDTVQPQVSILFSV